MKDNNCLLHFYQGLTGRRLRLPSIQRQKAPSTTKFTIIFYGLIDHDNSWTLSVNMERIHNKDTNNKDRVFCSFVKQKTVKLVSFTKLQVHSKHVSYTSFNLWNCPISKLGILLDWPSFCELKPFPIQQHWYDGWHPLWLGQGLEPFTSNVIVRLKI